MGYIESFETEPVEGGVRVKATYVADQFHVVDPSGIHKIDFGNGKKGFVVNPGSIVRIPATEPEKRREVSEGDRRLIEMLSDNMEGRDK